MLSKVAMLLLGVISEGEKGAYEMTKMLDQMQMKWWFNIGDSTVYATIKSLEKKSYIAGRSDKQGNMPERTIYTITQEGLKALKETITKVLRQMDFDTTTVSIALNYLYIFSTEESKCLLNQRMSILTQYTQGIEVQLHRMKENGSKPLHIANLIRMRGIVEAELIGTEQILKSIGG